jgi:cobalamin biosynthesis Mg chelatase CobN
MSDNDNDIDGLLLRLSDPHHSRHRDALTSLVAERDRLKEELERERLRLAACGVVAMSNTRETAKENRQVSDEYRSASFDDVCAAVDREMALRERVAELEAHKSVSVRLLLAERNALKQRVADLESQNPSDCEVLQAVMMNREAELRVTCSALAGIYSNPNGVGDPVRNGQIAAAAAKAALDALSQPRAWSTCDPVRDLCGDRDSDLDGAALAEMRKGEQP